MNAVLHERRASTADMVMLRFGPGRQLMGILEGGEGSGPILLLPSAGLQPRCGPFRLHAQLARRLAARGMRSFRYDIPGVGEAPRLGTCDASEATVLAMDLLQSTQDCQHFAVGGICSAADTGWDVANRDPRITAVLLLDGLCFAGPWYHYGRAMDLLRRLPGEWRHFLRSVPRRLRAARAGTAIDSTAYRTWPSHVQAREQFARLVQRKVRLLWLFSGGYADRFVHARQFGWTFGPAARDPEVTMRYWPECDHTYFARAHRERLIATIEEWMFALRARDPA